MNTSAVDREQRTFDAVPTSARAARQFVSETLRGHSASVGAINDMALAVSELATNIIEHGNGSTLVVYVDVADAECWEIEVTGEAAVLSDRLINPRSWAVAGADESSGRGLGIVRHVMDEVSTTTTGNRISIRCRRQRADRD
jgi:anti-sigma regulatory factor (Ser/Thr protein kinase)